MAAARPNVETHLLLQLLGQMENREVDWCAGPQWDWQPFADACDRNQVTALAFRRLDSLPKNAIPAALLAYLRERFFKISLTNYLLANKLVALASQLEAEDIPVLAYKGPALALAVYGDLALRQYQDLDLVVHPEHLPKAIQVMRRAGFRLAPDYRLKSRRDLRRDHHALFHAPDQSHFVELHWQLAGSFWHAFSPEVEKMWSRSEPIQLPHGRVSTMCREDLFLALCSHGTRHRWWCLKWVVDVAELLRNADAWNWSGIEEITAKRPGVGVCARLGLLLAHELLGAPVPNDAARILPMTERIRNVAEAICDEIRLRGQTDGDPHRTLMALEARYTERMKYRAAETVRSTSWWFLQVFNVSPMDRTLVPLPEKLAFLYFLIRPLRLAVKYGGRASRSLWSRAQRSVRSLTVAAR